MEIVQRTLSEVPCIRLLWSLDYVILDQGKVATCTTADMNQTMRRVAEKVGFTAI